MRSAKLCGDSGLRKKNPMFWQLHMFTSFGMREKTGDVYVDKIHQWDNVSRLLRENVLICFALRSEQCPAGRMRRLILPNYVICSLMYC